MSTSTSTDLCRVVIVAPRRRIDVALPVGVPLTHLLPTLLRAGGENLADSGLAHSGWVLQRLDEAPFDVTQSLSVLGVRDGEVLYFRPRMAQLPEPAFDDVADVIATGIREGTDRWGPRATRVFALAVAAGLLLLGAVALLLAGPRWLLPAICAGSLSGLLVVGGIVMSRVVGDAGAGAVLGYCAVVYGFVGGLLAPARSVALVHLGAPHLLAGFGAAVLVAMVSGFAIAEGLPNFLGIGIAGLVGVACAGTVMAKPGTSASGLGATAVAVLLVLTALIPSLAFRLARLPLPAVPANAEELRRSTLPVNGKAVLERTGQADRFATGLVLAVCLVTLAAQLFLVGRGGWLAVTTSLVVSAVVLLRARVFQGLGQRSLMLSAGFVGLGLLALLHARQTPVLALVPLVVAAAVLTGLATWLPDHKPTPFWGRAGDILDMLLVVAVVPLALGLLGVYAWVRGLGG